MNDYEIVQQVNESDEWAALDLKLDELMKADEGVAALGKTVAVLESLPFSQWEQAAKIGVAVMGQAFPTESPDKL